MPGLTIWLVIGALWCLPAAGIIVLYVYEVWRRRRTWHPAPRPRFEQERRAQPRRVAALASVRAPAHPRRHVPHGTPQVAAMDLRRIEVPVLIANGAGQASVHQCTLDLN